MPKINRWVPAIACLALTASSCQDPPPAETGPAEQASIESAAPTRLELKEIMRSLETDLATVAHGLWIADHEAVREAAERIADHPKVIPEQMGAIQGALGDEFPAFVQRDQAVHHAAVELAEAADSSGLAAESFAIFLRIQQGCMSCHTDFRERVIEAVARVGAGG